MAFNKKGLVFRTISEIRGPILVVEGVRGAAYNELVEIKLSDGRELIGNVLDSYEDKAIVQVFGMTEGLDLNAHVRFTGEVIKIPVSDDMIGRIFSGSLKPLDGLPPPIGDEEREIFFSVLNPAAREPPSEFIQTGISVIDGMLSLVRGQKLPIFSESGLPHNVLAAQIARQATIPGKEEDFAIVFVAMGIKHEEFEYFKREFEKTQALNKAVLILNLASDPIIERIITPRVGLTIAEYLAFDVGMHVLVIMTDMTNYAEALRTISTAREEVPARKGYPGYLYTDLATIYERAGKIKGGKGSVTLIPILTMPGGDITHPVPDLTGYITEGQIFLDRELNAKGIYPPVNVLSSLSRLMPKGIGEGKTRDDHHGVANQLFSSYARGLEVRELAVILGEGALTETDKKYLEFAKKFEEKFVRQGENDNRSIEETLSIGWQLLAILPKSELKRVKSEHIDKYLQEEKKVKEKQAA